jgi:hypothetical protein
LQLGSGEIPVLVIGGIHAREWAPPDALLAFAQKILESFRLNAPFTDSAFTWPTSPADKYDTDTSSINFPAATIIDAPTVKRIMTRLKLFIIPCTNPTGREYTIVNRLDPVKSQWRKNRKDVGAACGEIGVDLNRNFDVGWDYQRYYDSTSAPHARVTDNPCSANADIYHGPAVSSEEETKNIKHVIDSFGIKFFLDVHSFSREIYYPSGLNIDQTNHPEQNYLNTSLNRDLVTNAGGRALSTPSYGEFMPAAILGEHISIANSMQTAILYNANGGSNAYNRIRDRSNYPVKQSLTLYPSPGASDDYAYGTQLSLSGNNAVPNAKYPVYAFAIEIGTIEEGGFQPSADPVTGNIYRKYQREVWSATSALAIYAANWTPVAAAAPAQSRGCLPMFLLIIGTSVVGMLLLFFYFLT